VKCGDQLKLSRLQQKAEAAMVWEIKTIICTFFSINLRLTNEDMEGN